MVSAINLHGLEEYRDTFLGYCKSLDLESLAPVLDVLRSTIASESGFIFVCGNGGSAALSQHFAIDLGLGTHRKSNKGGCRIFDLTSNASVLTATANDTGYENVFSSQLDLYSNKGDLLIAISSSGNSINIIEAIKKARDRGVTTIGLTGFDGGEVRRLVNFSIHVETEAGNYGIVEDLHSFVLHILTHFIRITRQTEL